MKEPLDRELTALLDAERGRAGPGAAMRSRVLARVQASTAAHPPSGPAPRTGPAAPVGGAILRPGLVLVSALLVGVAGWVALRSQPTPSPSVASVPPVPSVPAAVAPVSANEPAFPAASIAPPAPPVDPSAGPDRVVVPGAGGTRLETRASTLPQERAILDRARSHLLSGEPTAALADVEKHARLFPHGVLGEERDALRVEGLVAAQRYAAGRAAAARFHAAYPGSMLAPAVDDVLHTIP
jgi:hypothetical protein